MPNQHLSLTATRVRKRQTSSQSADPLSATDKRQPRHRERPDSDASQTNSRAAGEARQNPQGLSPPLFDPTVVWHRTEDLTPHPRNARTHSGKQVTQIAKSIKQFGFTNPVLTDAESRIIAGHGRVEAARQLGLEQVPTIRFDHLSEEEIRAYVIADNRLAEIAGWDRELLGIELQFLSASNLDFDVEVTGFETAEIDLMIEGLETDETDEADQIPKPEVDQAAITRHGDLWLLGQHRLLCGDAQDQANFERLMAGEAAQMVFTDPPYNVPINGHVSGLGEQKHREFVMGSGEMTEKQFAAFLATVFANHADHSADGAIHFICMDWRHIGEVIAAGRGAYTELKNLCIWAKTNAGMGSLYRSQHELVFVFKVGTEPHINNVELGKHGRYRTNLWTYPGINSFGKDRNAELALHPTVKPTALVADAIKDCTRRGDIVLDGFAGSGTTLIAAEQTGRIGYGLELDPRYVDTAVRRWERHTGKKASHAETHLTMDELAETRGISTASKPDGSANPGSKTGKEVDHDK